MNKEASTMYDGRVWGLHACAMYAITSADLSLVGAASNIAVTEDLPDDTGSRCSTVTPPRGNCGGTLALVRLRVCDAASIRSVQADPDSAYQVIGREVEMLHL